MNSLFKTLANGFLYFFISPFLALILVLGLLWGLIIFIFQFIKQIFIFFQGRTLFSDYPEDIKAKEIQAYQRQNRLNPGQKGDSNAV